MPNQQPSLIMKGRDGGWEGTQIQFYTCTECGCQSSGAGQHSGWHDNLTNQLNQLAQAIQNEAQQRQQADQNEAQQRQQADNNLSNRISALGG
jgi:hypothetical protein